MRLVILHHWCIVLVDIDLSMDTILKQTIGIAHVKKIVARCSFNEVVFDDHLASGNLCNVETWIVASNCVSMHLPDVRILVVCRVLWFTVLFLDLGTVC